MDDDSSGTRNITGKTWKYHLRHDQGLLTVGFKFQMQVRMERDMERKFLILSAISTESL